MSASTDPDKAFDWISEIGRKAEQWSSSECRQVHNTGRKIVVSTHQHSHRRFRPKG